MNQIEEKMPYYPTVDANPDFVKLEEEILAFWKRENIFQKSVDKNKSTGEHYVFYDGPPFANGLPHYGHLLTGYVKDLVARYQTMRGKVVERRFGWDCHGLPAEMGAEKELGISGRQAIIEYGIGKFNEYCRENVMRYASEWERYVDRQGRWVDFQNDYKTMDRDFMESVIWAFSELYKKGLIYESYRVMPYSWAAETPLSNFETRLDNATREREDKAITVAFELDSRPEGAPEADKYYLLAWTTTPWTLPSNLALAVHPEMEYVCLTAPSLRGAEGDAAIQTKDQSGLLRSARNDVCYIFSGSANMIAGLFAPKDIKNSSDLDIWYQSEGALAPRIKGSALLNLTYKPLFPYFAHLKNPSPQPSPTRGEGEQALPLHGGGLGGGAFRILDGSSFIEVGSGTGVVHLAPGFGEDDQKVCEANGISIVCPVDDKGRYTDEIFDIQGSGVRSQESGKEKSAESRISNPESLSLKGLNVIADTRKEEGEPYTDAQLQKYGLANLRIINWLKQNGHLIKQEDFKHNYPHCWRTDTPIIYRALPSWYVQVTAFKDRAVELNKNIHWIPEHTRDGAMGHMLASAPDWSISRNRFWGCPIPVWKSPSEKIKVFGSIAELEKASGQKVEDLHRPYIDEIIIKEGGEEYRRVEEVLDCWFESGSMPYAQLHYPFENADKFKANYPGDFITEYIGQTRGWFNTLIMLATALFDEEPFKNCICHGVVIDEETGLKYSKRLKNYKDPMEVFDTFGADALRWLMVSSGVMRGHDLGVDPEGKFIRDVVRLNIKPIWNAYNFFTLYANADGVKAEFSTESENLMDQYILAKCRAMVEGIQTSLDAYDTPGACEAVTKFVEVLNNWYIRRCRPRFWESEKTPDKQAAYNTLYSVLHTLCRAAAPLLPFTLEAVFRGLCSTHGEEQKSPSPLVGEGRGEGANLTQLARNLRKNATDAEKLMWSLLRGNQLGVKFRRQEPIGKYIADFVCFEQKLIVELDGGQHAEEDHAARDAERTAWLEGEGFRVLRYWNNEVLQNLEGVAETIVSALRTPHPNPLPQGEREPVHPSPFMGEGRGGGATPLSVHLAEFPTEILNYYPAFHADASNGGAIIDMDKVREICNAALSVRTASNIRTRQPLAKITVYSDMEIGWGLEKNGYYKQLIADELNVKDIEFSRDMEVVATKRLDINSRVLGKRLPEKMKQIIPASKKGDWKLLERFTEKDGDGLEGLPKTACVGGEELINKFDFQAGEFIAEFSIKLEPQKGIKGAAPLSTNDALVVLDLTLTPELIAEGLARDVVRMVQESRKKADLHISDKISLVITAPEKVAAAVEAEENKRYIAEQVLAESVTVGAGQAEFSFEHELEGEKVVISFSRIQESGVRGQGSGEKNTESRIPNPESLKAAEQFL